VRVEEPERYGPLKAALAVAAVECSRQQHVDRADQNLVALGVLAPIPGRLAAHQHVDGHLLLAEPEALAHGERDLRRLLDERPHRERVDEAPWTVAPDAARIKPRDK